jgi:hypothetical protein
VNTTNPRVTRLTSQPDSEGFIRSDNGSLLFRNASASVTMAVAPALKGKAVKSTKGLEFRWPSLEEGDIRTLFSIVANLGAQART